MLHREFLATVVLVATTLAPMAPMAHTRPSARTVAAAACRLKTRYTTSVTPCDLGDVTIAVHSGGTGFVVRIAARDTEQAEEVLRRAHRLLG